jgi:hypothetical protein
VLFVCIQYTVTGGVAKLKLCGCVNVVDQVAVLVRPSHNLGSTDKGGVAARVDIVPVLARCVLCAVG